LTEENARYFPVFLVAVCRFPVFLTRLNSKEDFEKRFDNMLFQLSLFASSRLY